MTTVEKISLAISNKYFTLFKEGLFYKCYNEDAMVFVKNVKDCKVSEKFVKSVGAEVYSIGFPLFGLLVLLNNENVEITWADFKDFTGVQFTNSEENEVFKKNILN